jgi:hypothetical protein
MDKSSRSIARGRACLLDSRVAHLKACLERARARRCDYILFDYDGLEDPELPHYPDEDYEGIAREAGYRMAENVVVNKGFYWRPDDGLNFAPSKVFDTAEEAWRDCCEVNGLLPDEPRRMKDENPPQTLRRGA